jgi:hypothetical protein
MRQLWPRAALTLLSAVALAGVLPGAAAAACRGPVPVDRTWADPIGDGTEPFLDLTAMRVTFGDRFGRCAVRFDFGFAGPAMHSDTLVVRLDTDDAPETGEPGTGADRMVVASGSEATLRAWTGAAGNEWRNVAKLVGWLGFFVTSPEQLGVTAPGVIAVRASSIRWVPHQSVEHDDLPDLGAPAARLALSFTAAPARRTCRVPQVRRRTVATARARLRRAGCRHRVRRVASARVRAGRVVATRPSAGTLTRRTVTVELSRGPRGPVARRGGAAN